MSFLGQYKILEIRNVERRVELLTYYKEENCFFVYGIDIRSYGILSKKVKPALLQTPPF